ncbi:MAG: dephospho-CoA kinase [Muribaculaceae bacterium]|nr:dephospho-CoA kinase [Muribaculaceae bacterium]
MTRLPLIAITGGIGAGKSVVSNVLRVMGYEVFDCDSEAKIIMDSDEEIKHRLIH